MVDKSARIVSLGSALQDIYLIDRDDFQATTLGDSTIFGHLPIGTKAEIDRISFEIGGAGTNSATEFVRHGHESIILANLGHDSAGDAIISFLDKEGIDTSYIQFNSRICTGISILLLDVKTGERTILTHRGASAKFNNLREDDLDLIRPDWLYVSSLRGDMDTLERFFKKAHRMGCRIMFNPGKREICEKKRLLDLLYYTDILLVNQVEAAQLVPGTILPELLSHLSPYVKTVIITAGSMGAIASDGQKSYRFGLYEDVKVKDTTGAGDAFGSGFLAHLAAGYNFKESLIYASANSTSVVRKLGAHAGLLTGQEDLHLMPIQEV